MVSLDRTRREASPEVHSQGPTDIRTDEDDREIKACWGAPKESEATDKLDALVALMKSYEA
jgi:hypothetical protein